MKVTIICDCSRGTDKVPGVTISIEKKGIRFKCMDCGAEEFRHKYHKEND